MKRSFLILSLLAAALLCSCNNGGYHIRGTVTDPALEGAIVFLVPVTEPVHLPEKDNLDSTFIKNGRFEFKGTKERLVDVRIEKLKRMGVQNLLVVTEPGEIEVVIGAKSSGCGTPQNDSLQVWKDITENRLKLGFTPQTYMDRTRGMAHAVGDESTLGSFLLGLYPEK